MHTRQTRRARIHREEGKSVTTLARSPRTPTAALVYTWPLSWLCPERRTVSQRSSSASYHARAPLSSLSPARMSISQPLSVQFVYLSFANFVASIYRQLTNLEQERSLIRSANATQTGSRADTPEVLFSRATSIK